jgi:hypothetical protein
MRTSFTRFEQTTTRKQVEESADESIDRASMSVMRQTPDREPPAAFY